MKSVYPVIFTQTENIVLVEVPDLNILTEGKDMADAISMARDTIGLNGIALEDANDKIPDPSRIEDVNVNEGTFSSDGKNYISMVDIDFAEYRRRNDNKTVRRNVTLPNWLNQEAEKEKLNVSKVLQEALVARLGLQR
ncbi:MAG: type II toxin-antitoxin system HicB family antitoxin [Lachnospiraceae bacterium]|nr:type II toxin-antitoxin system HicB family antitoxin [Lachnospiraceae bacterium]